VETPLDIVLLSSRSNHAAQVLVLPRFSSLTFSSGRKRTFALAPGLLPCRFFVFSMSWRSVQL